MKTANGPLRGEPHTKGRTTMNATTKTTHTPGPWHFNESTDLDRWLANIATAKDNGQGPVYSGDADVVAAFDEDNKPNEADARLMTAAPEMLDLLVDVASDGTLGPLGLGKCRALVARLNA